MQQDKNRGYIQVNPNRNSFLDPISKKGLGVEPHAI
jgi:hypothetical protein